MNYKDFVKEYTENPLIVNDHVLYKYIPLSEKIARADNIINASYYIEVEKPDGTKEKKFHVDSVVRMMLFKISLIDMYTDLERGEGDSVLDEYDQLCRSSALDIIIDSISKNEFNEFTSVVECVANDVMTNEYELHAFVKDQVERFGMLIGTVLSPIIEKINVDDIVKAVEEKVKE